MAIDFPGDPLEVQRTPSKDVDKDGLRFDLGLGGEVVCLDWGQTQKAVSQPNINLTHHMLMNGRVRAVLYQESTATAYYDTHIFHRMTRLSCNPFIKPLPQECDDPVIPTQPQRVSID